MEEKLRKIKNDREVDFILIVLVTILVTFGVVMVFSASYYDSIYADGTPYSFLKKQAFFAVTGFVMMMIISHVDYHIICKGSNLIAGAEILMLLAVLFTPLGVEVNGAKRWLSLGLVNFTIMPGEIAKLAVIVLAATIFAKNKEKVKNLSGLMPVVLYTAVVCLLILKQPNLSTAVTVAAIAVGIAFLAGMQWRYVALMGAGGIGLVFYVVAKVREAMAADEELGYQLRRIVCFLDPFKFEDDEGFQVVQSLLALGTGGIKGTGLGMSVQKNLYLPEPQNDFILAIIGEELGFLGIAAVMIVFVVLVWRILMVAVESKDALGTLLAGGVAIMIGVQVLFNIAVVTSSMPPTGVALPFISYGGNAIWIMMWLMGIVLNISRQTQPATAKNKKE